MSQTADKTAAKPMRYQPEKAVGQGTFGTVMLARSLDQGNALVAIKKVIQDPRFKNRELQIMKSLNHPNVVTLIHHFFTNGETKPDELYLNLVMEFVPETLHRCCRDFTKRREPVPLLLVKCFAFQLLRSLGYIHHPQVNVCHRDIKPHNLLVDAENGVLKLCDFGSAKQLVSGEPNVAYICSRYYRAPELIFGAQHYSTAIDTWSAGCIIAEMLLGDPIFKGDNSMNQLVEIIKVLGTPSKQQVDAMHRKAVDTKMPQVKPRPWAKVFASHVPEQAHDLVSKLLRYVPGERISPYEAMCHPFFDEIHDPSIRLPSGKPVAKAVFAFTTQEKEAMTPQQLRHLVRQ